MNCESFETIVVDLASEGLLEVDVRSAGLAHAKACADCSVRIEDELGISAALRHFAQSSHELEASPALETALLAAFRQQEVFRVGQPFAAARTPVRRRYHWTAAIAAAVLTAIVSAAAVKFIILGGDTGTRTIKGAVAESSPGGSGPADPGSQQNPVSQGESTPVTGDLTSDRDIPKDNARAERFKPRYVPRDVSYRTAETRPVTANPSVPSEIMTEFMPISYASAMTPIESGHVVRVELPRTALASFGLSLNENDNGGRVKADVLIDDFGTARAIRFVR